MGNPSGDDLLTRVVRLEREAQGRDKLLLTLGSSLLELKSSTTQVVQALQRKDADLSHDLDALRQRLITVMREMTEAALR